MHNFHCKRIQDNHGVIVFREKGEDAGGHQ